MRRRVFTAAMTMLMGGAGLMVSASAQSISTDTLSATQVPAELEEGAPLALGSGSFGAGGFSLFPRASEWNAGTNAFASTDEGVFLGGHYSRVPAYGLLPAANLAEDNVELRDLSMSARILPGLQLDFAKWNYSSELGFGDSRAAGVIENSVVTGTGLRSPFEDPCLLALRPFPANKHGCNTASDGHTADVFRHCTSAVVCVITSFAAF